MTLDNRRSSMQPVPPNLSLFPFKIFSVCQFPNIGGAFLKVLLKIVRDKGLFALTFPGQTCHRANAPSCESACEYLLRALWRGRHINGRGRRCEPMYLMVRMIYTDLYDNTDDNVLLGYLPTRVSCVPYRLPTYIFIAPGGGDGGMSPLGSKSVSRQHTFAEL